MKHLHRAFTGLFLASACLQVIASDNAIDGTPEAPASLNVAVDTRFDFDSKDYQDAGDENGFYGRYLNLIIKGSINSELSFNIRHRLNKFGEMKNDVFGATDWAYLDYSPNDSWTFSGGKQVVAIGGYEYDAAPIDIYFASMFWYNIGCYQFGVSSTYHFDEGRQNILLQVSNSPYRAIGDKCYAYNLMWMGRVANWSTLWSANLIEYLPGEYGNIISLGNRFDFDKAYVELDFMNRYWGKNDFLFGDFSIIAKACLSLGRIDVFAKGGFDRFSVVPGSGQTVEKPFCGVGAEFYPLHGSRNLRLHAIAAITHDDTTGKRISEIGAGLMWRVNLLNR